MTTISIIKKHSTTFFRLALSLALIFSVAFGAVAQTGWDGKTAVLPEGEGTLEKPFIIASAENLFHVAKNPSRYEGMYLVQTCDIDLNGMEWTPIGTNAAPFKGIYDGMSYTIRNLRVDWGDYAKLPSGGRNANHYAYGLFGYFMGSVKNLVIDGAEIYQSAPTKQTVSSNDLRVGILAGAVACSEGGYIKNILIRTAKITSHEDNKEKSGNYFIAQAYMIGGLVGDIHANDSYTSTTEVKENFTIENISVSADFELGNTILDPDRTFSNKGLQFYVGGVVGRARSVYLRHMPKHVLYSGTINAPRAMVGPIFGGARAKGGNSTNNIVVTNYTGSVNGYAGDFWDQDKENGKATDEDFTDAFYYDFHIKNYSDENNVDYLLINDTATPSTLHDNTTGATHTLKAQETFTFDAANLTPDKMAMFQGVNRGTYKDMSDEATRVQVLEWLNEGNDNPDHKFVWRNGRVELQGKEEMMGLERKNIYLFEATMRNLKADVDYTYKWTISNANGKSWSASCQTNDISQTNDPSTDVALKIVNAGKISPSCAVVGENRHYTRIRLDVYNDATLVASQSRDIGDVSIRLEQGVYTKSTEVEEEYKDEEGNPVLDDNGEPIKIKIENITKEHFLFTAHIEIEGHDFATDTEFFKGVTCEWKIKVGNDFVPIDSNSGYLPENFTTEGAVAHIKSSYVGAVHFKATSVNQHDNNKETTITSSVVNNVTVPYIEQIITGLHLSITMEEYCGTVDGKIKTQPFDPTDYLIEPENGKNGFYDEVYKNDPAKYDKEGSIEGITDETKIKPLIFKVTVVDQFGNDWTSSDPLNRYRIQWNYRISGEGYNGHNSTNYDGENSPTDGHYDKVNGWFGTTNASDPTAPNGLLSDIDDKVETDYNNINKEESEKRKGHFKLIGDSILIIHPNILHRTSAFWVRVKLFDIVNDPQGNHPSEKVLSFNQLGIMLTKNTQLNTIDGKVLWSMDPEKKTYVSGTSYCDLIWYRSTDPTVSPDKWEKVQESKNVFSRETTLNPRYYNDRYFYKLYYKSGSDLEVEEIIGPQNVIFVYDRAMTNANIERTDFNTYDQQTNQFYPTGLDINHGHDPYHAVTSMAKAYSMLNDKGAATDNATDNVIVVMGYMEDDDFLLYNTTTNYKCNATITGTFENIKGSTLYMAGENEKGRKLQAATIFKDLTLYGGDLALHLYCGLNDVTFDRGMKMVKYKDQPANANGLGDYMSPQITVIGGFHNYDNTGLIYPETNADPEKTTMTFRSGTFGRIISGARTNGGYNKTSYNIFGHPEWPHRVKVVVNIRDKRSDAEKEVYPYDIGLLVGGQTDGSIYTESEIEMHDGTVGRYISGNISYGRSVGDAHPADSFFGSTTLNLYGGQIKELFGGTLGRHEATSGESDHCDAYFYGRSIINVYDGTISSNIYGAGAAGVVGLGNDTNHTNDPMIPYKTTDANGYTKIAYGDYNTVKAANGELPTMVLLNGESLDLADSYCEVNLRGGTVVGDIYGGGYGYSEQVPVERALDQAGYLFGRSYVNLYDGVVKGNVYGGGAGADGFYKKALKKYKDATDAADAADATEKQKWSERMAAFEDLANVYGDTQVTMKGGIVEDHVYAGSKGIPGFPKMATLYGNTNLVVENVVTSDNFTRVPIVNGNIFGGSELGRIEGNTNVEIKGGAIGNNIFGGSEGIESGENKTTAIITGSTKVTITDGTYFTPEHIARISDDNNLQLTPADRTFNIYGGGYRNCVIEKSTTVKITKSLLTSFNCLLEGRSFMECVEDRTYRKYSVYGGGRGELTDVKENTNVNINILEGTSAPSSRPVDIANNQQFFMIAGGGMAGHVWGNTNVELDGNVFARRIYGAGMYGNVLGNANMTVRRGSYYGIFGGGLLGNVKGSANLRIGTKAGVDEMDNSITVLLEDAADANRNLYVYENVYGGNDVSGCTGYDITDNLWNDGNYTTFYTLDGILNETDEVKSHHYLFEHWSERNGGKPYYRHLIKASEDHGVNMKIYGGKILGDVFGAGNGNHTGYYVPNIAESESHSAEDYIERGIVTRMKFFEGLPYHYRVNKKDANSYEGTPNYDAATNTYTGTLKSVLNEQVRKDYGLYEYRPRVGKVVMHIGGNSETDRVVIDGAVFGGGHACTIGKYDPSRDVLTDPLRFEGGGSLKMNFGSHVTVKNAVYMGSRGRIIGQQTIKGEHDYNGITLNSDMDYHYYDHTSGKYLLGFPNTKEGRMRFHAYIQLVNMDATTELSFYDQTDNTQSTDVRWGSFFAGGARGSMTKKILAEDDPDYVADKHKPYEYTLPAGLTIETRVVGGSEDAEITYYDYTSKTGDDAFTAIDETKPIFTFYGGIVYDDHIEGHYGGGQVRWHSAPTGTPDDDTMVGDESPRGSLTVMKLNVNCQFDPQLVEGKNDNYADVVKIDSNEEEKFTDYFGGIVYGGCYNSGITNGSVEVTCTNNMLGDHFESNDYHDYLSWSSLRRNIGRVYGGGFGEHATILGNTKVTLTDNARCFNVFGGGMSGDVIGGTDVTIKGLSLVYNAVYGGSLRGNIGLNPEDYFETVGSEKKNIHKDLYAKGTHVRLISGGVDRVYGGGFIGTIYGGTHVVASDEDQDEGTPRLMIGTIYGGNDVSGDVLADENATIDGTSTGAANPAEGYSTFIRVNEVPRADKESYTMSHQEEIKDGTGKITKTNNYYGGFPLIGSIYGAGNGNMGDYINGVYIEQDAHEYKRGLIHIASGNGADYHTLNLGNREGLGEGAYQLPDIAGKTRITINGGTIVNVYGGGSMCTVKGSDEVIVNYADTVARAAVPTSQLDPMTWGVLRMFEDLQQQEVTTIFPAQKDAGGTETQPETLRFSYQIYRVFGGNNLMDMAIQPKLDLRRGQLFSVYSGGNFGRMTYIKDTDNSLTDAQKADVNVPRGLSLTIDSPDIRIASVYGGGRVGDIYPMLRKQVEENGETVVKHIPVENEGGSFGENDFGATLNIKNGLIGEVYGGNNVAGKVHYGTHVNISGAISGNVYGSGNGNYIYYYDHEGTHSDPIVENQISEGYNESYGGRYFILPKKEAYPGKYYGNSDEEKILAINSYRPNVDKALLEIEGKAQVGEPGETGYQPVSTVYVRGNVYCGGNSSTVLYDPINTGGNNKIQMKIGSHVTLGGVFLGSNGEGLANPLNITYLANLNGINMNKANGLRSGGSLAEASVAYYDKPSFRTDLYPNLLSLYMRAAEVTALPYGFTLPDNTTDAYIGNFTVGGNYGSMMTDQTIKITLPECLTIYGRIVGGCYNSRIDFQGATALGGMTMPLGKDENNNQLTDKVQLTIKSKFRPWRLYFDEKNHEAKLVNDRQKRIIEGDKVLFVDVDDKDLVDGETYYYTEGKCNTSGGCFTSGKTVGNIKIDLYSDVLGLYENGGTWLTKNDNALTDGQGRNLQVDRDKLMNNVAIRRTVYAVTGAGYGPQTEVEGDIRIRLLPKENGQLSNGQLIHPTIATTFGGAHDGKHIGNSVTEIRDGMVFSSIYGGSRAALKYGSSEVIVGYPTYYICKENATFTLDRADKVSYVAQAQKEDADKTVGTKTYKYLNHDDTQVIKQTVKYRKGDIVAANVYQQILNADKASKFDKIEITPATLKTMEDVTLASSWDKIDINIGDNSQKDDPSAHFYGGGGIYGGGIAINETAQTYSGVNTQLSYNEETVGDKVVKNYLNHDDIGFGGNSTIIVGDDPSSDNEHISIGTSHYVPVNINPTKGDKIGTYAKIGDSFVHQGSGAPETGVSYYKMETEGGIYGDGRRTFVENFRAVDITGYGYAAHTPQDAKLINTFQRIDLLSLNDCCLQLQGAQDYATNSIDATLYSIARVGEIRMNSTKTGNIECSITDPANSLVDVALTTPKSRNYMGFYKNAHFIGAIYSNVNFTDTYRGSNGTEDGTYTYKSYKKKVIKDYEGSTDRSLPAVVENFKKRNLGTSPNMVGINNGYTLKLQNTFTTKKSESNSSSRSGDGSGSGNGSGNGSGSSEPEEQGMLKEVPEDNIYYGPIVGVVEVKLLTLSPDEGGGYIYAFNLHEADDNTGLKQDDAHHTFLEETGNFVFASKIETKVENEQETTTTNYIIDDCYPLGYYNAEGNANNPSHATDEEVHYWYVQGNKYFFNTTLTGYTYNNPISFFLNNSDNLIMLSGIEPGNTTTIESVYWQEHVKTDEQPVADDKCALTNNLNASGDDSRDKYKLYLTIDQETRDRNLSLHKDINGKYDQTKNAFVARIPNGNNPNDESAPVGGVIQQHNTYAGDTNSPILGIRLEDSDVDNQTPDFYNAHLSDPDLVVIKIKSKNPTTNDEFEYTINLTINYLQGPYLKGNIAIENCALPGEYIYANTGKITAVMDESLTITGKKWYLYPRVWEYNKNSGHDEYKWDENQAVDVSQYMMDNVTGDISRLQLPARYYQNDWQLNYVMVVNGQEFPLTNEGKDVPRLTVHNYHRMSTVAKAVKDMTDTANEVKASNAGYNLDLDLVGGCLVYIEDDEDFEIFTKYVNYCNGFRTSDEWSSADAVYGEENYKVGSSDSPDASGNIVWQKDKTGDGWARVLRAEVLPGYNRYGCVTGYSNNNTVLGYDDNQSVEFMNLKNPSGAEGIRFVLNADVTLTKNTMPITEFRGNFNGNGHTISFGSVFKGDDFIERNYGTIRDVGFVSNGGENTGDVTFVVKSNRGIVENSYYYHFPVNHPESVADFSRETYSGLVGKNDDKNTVEGAVQNFAGKVINCVQNTNKGNANSVTGMRYRENKMFHNGRVAYNLNREYLNARYLSKDDDHKVREEMELPTYDQVKNTYSSGDYLYSYYANGDYRYGNVRSAEHPEGVRLSDNFGVPNYENYLGDGRTMHITNEDVAHDDRRWFETSRSDIIKIDDRGNIEYDFSDGGSGLPVLTNEGYFPIYRYDARDKNGKRKEEYLADHSDFIFFGQRLTADPDERDYYPRRVTNTNRVFRAGGSYGRRTDIGFYFNRDAWALSPELTAIDFTGQADLKDAQGKLIYADDWNYYYYYYYGGGGNATNEYTKFSSTGFTTAQEEEILKMVESGVVGERQTRMLCYYPPMLDLPGGDQNHNLHNLVDFHVDSNNDIHDYTKVTKNLLVYTPEVEAEGSNFTSEDNDRLFGQLHYTRMQRWGEPENETDQNDIIGHHIQWINHDNDTGLDSHFHAYGGLFHLVDLQDFNAPIEFHVVGDGGVKTGTNGRAWLLRHPEYYSLRSDDYDVNIYEDDKQEKFKIGKSGWRSLSLPFTANRVLAVNSVDYMEKYSRGQITHFYGTSDTQHDYWLRGFIGAFDDDASHVDENKDNVVKIVNFARPGKSYTDDAVNPVTLFDLDNVTGIEGIQMKGDYTYKNDWFSRAYGGENGDYVPNHDIHKEEGILFEQYHYITKNAPYIIAFPGKDYYEYDLSGQFYNEKNNASGCNEQEILYEFTVDEIDPENNFPTNTLAVIIPVTDVYDGVRTTTATTVSGVKVNHNGTFKRIAGNDIKDNMYVLNTKELTGVTLHDAEGNPHTYSKIPVGSVFVKVNTLNALYNDNDGKEHQEILPFRTYITIDTPTTNQNPAPPILFIGDGTRGISSVGDEDEPDEQYSGVQLWVQGHDLVVTSDHDFSLPLYGYSGQLYRRLTVRAGKNVYKNLSTGVYVAYGKKFVVK